MSVEFRAIMKRDFNCVSRLYRRCVCGCLLSEGITLLSYRLLNRYAIGCFAPCAVGVPPNIHSNIQVIYNLKFMQYAVGELHKIVRKWSKVCRWALLCLCVVLESEEVIIEYDY